MSLLAVCRFSVSNSTFFSDFLFFLGQSLLLDFGKGSGRTLDGFFLDGAFLNGVFSVIDFPVLFCGVSGT